MVQNPTSCVAPLAPKVNKGVQIKIVERLLFEVMEGRIETCINSTTLWHITSLWQVYNTNCSVQVKPVT